MQLWTVNSKEFSAAGAGEVSEAPGGRGWGESILVSVPSRKASRCPALETGKRPLADLWVWVG